MIGLGSSFYLSISLPLYLSLCPYLSLFLPPLSPAFPSSLSLISSKICLCLQWSGELPPQPEVPKHPQDTYNCDYPVHPLSLKNPAVAGMPLSLRRTSSQLYGVFFPVSPTELSTRSRPSEYCSMVCILGPEGGNCNNQRAGRPDEGSYLASIIVWWWW